MRASLQPAARLRANPKTLGAVGADARRHPLGMPEAAPPDHALGWAEAGPEKHTRASRAWSAMNKMPAPAGLTLLNLSGHAVSTEVPPSARTRVRSGRGQLRPWGTLTVLPYLL